MHAAASSATEPKPTQSFAVHCSKDLATATILSTIANLWPVFVTTRGNEQCSLASFEFSTFDGIIGDFLSY